MHVKIPTDETLDFKLSGSVTKLRRFEIRHAQPCDPDSIVVESVYMGHHGGIDIVAGFSAARITIEVICPVDRKLFRGATVESLNRRIDHWLFCRLRELASTLNCDVTKKEECDDKA